MNVCSIRITRGVGVMERTEICRHIDDGANFYLRLLGDAEHMEYIDNGYYSIIRPKNGQEGGTSLFNIRLEHLSDDELNNKIKEIKELNLHIWWGFGLSERMLNAVFGDNRPVPATEINDEEGCMALLPDEKPEYEEILMPITVKKVDNAEDFKIWANISNKILHGGYPIMHPENHYHLCRDGIMPCYIAYYNDTAAGVCSIINNKDISSLEFVATVDEYRRKGIARAVCAAAVDEAFQNGSKIITLRAFPGAKKLYGTLGFKIY
jgi:GNAT superfamily N-acetyltransferase